MFIELRDVSKYYGKIKAVDSLSLDVYEGDVYGFLGPNGSGKSTSIRMILSLIKPTSGSIRLFGNEINFGRNHALTRIGALIETPDFYNYLSARRNLKILGQLSGINDPGNRVDEVLDIVGLKERGHSRVRTFSKGMKQRLGIAQAILHKPDLIILDEPTSGLDPQGQKEIRALINSLKNDFNITILLSSHILFEIEQIASRMIIINKGKAMVEGSVDELIHSRQQQVNIRFGNPDTVSGLVSTSGWSSKLIGRDGDKFSFLLGRDEIPEFTRYMTQKGSDIFSIEPIRSLEDYFLQITENGQAD